MTTYRVVDAGHHVLASGVFPHDRAALAWADGVAPGSRVQRLTTDPAAGSHWSTVFPTTHTAPAPAVGADPGAATALGGLRSSRS